MYQVNPDADTDTDTDLEKADSAMLIPTEFWDRRNIWKGCPDWIVILLAVLFVLAFAMSYVIIIVSFNQAART
jgi:hypothetical protein